MCNVVIRIPARATRSPVSFLRLARYRFPSFVGFSGAIVAIFLPRFLSNPEHVDGPRLGQISSLGPTAFGAYQGNGLLGCMAGSLGKCRLQPGGLPSYCTRAQNAGPGMEPGLFCQDLDSFARAPAAHH